jgi:hypothetical protein
MGQPFEADGVIPSLQEFGSKINPRPLLVIYNPDNGFRLSIFSVDSGSLHVMKIILLPKVPLEL